SGDLVILSLWRWRGLRLFLSALARFHFYLRGGHGVGDMNFVANFDVTRDLGVRIASDLPTVFSLLDRDHRIIHFQDWPCDLVCFRSAESYAAKSETRCG